jgi:hypothetical protein
MFDRCKALGEYWEFMYEATYRDLCEAVHVSFLKVPHAASLAIRTGDAGALLYEHARTMNYAVMFWGITIVDCCKNHPDQGLLKQFQSTSVVLVTKASRAVDELFATANSHIISF